jgi:hypothetical protein
MGKKGRVRNMPAKIAMMMVAGEYGVTATVFPKKNTGNNTAMPHAFFLQKQAKFFLICLFTSHAFLIITVFVLPVSVPYTGYPVLKFFREHENFSVMAANTKKIISLNLWYFQEESHGNR